MGEKIIAGGAWVRIVAGDKIIGLATGASFDEDWAVNPANVIGFLGPIDYDSQGYSCSITIQSFVPEVVAKAGERTELPGGSNTTITDMLPTRQGVQDNGGKLQEIDTLTFQSIDGSTVYATFRKVMIASNGAQIAPNSYITANVRMVAVERTQGITA